MAIVDPEEHLLWGSVGFPGNSHDSNIFKSTKVYKIIEDIVIAEMAQKYSNINVYPMILGDGAFQFRPWQMKPFSNVKLTQHERYLTTAYLGPEWSLKVLLAFLESDGEFCTSNVRARIL